MKFKFTLLFFVLGYFFNLSSMSFFNNPGRSLVQAVNKGQKDEVIVLLQNKNISKKSRNKSLLAAIFKNNRELVDILIDNGANLPELHYSNFYKNIIGDKDKIELCLYVFGYLLLMDRWPNLDIQWSKRCNAKKVINQAYIDYIFQTNTNYQAISYFTGMNQDCCKLIVQYIDKIDGVKVKIQDIIYLRYDNNWLRIMRIIFLNLCMDITCQTSGKFGDIDLHYISIFLPYASAECKQDFLKFVQEKKCEKAIKLAQDIISKEANEFDV